MTAPATFGQQLYQMRRGSHAMIQALHGIDRACAHFAAVANAPVPPPLPPTQATVAETVQSFGQPPVPPTEQPLASALASIRRRLTGQPAPSLKPQPSGPPPIEDRYVRPGGGRMQGPAANEGAQS